MKLRARVPILAGQGAAQAGARAEGTELDRQRVFRRPATDLAVCPGPAVAMLNRITVAVGFSALGWPAPPLFLSCADRAQSHVVEYGSLPSRPRPVKVGTGLPENVRECLWKSQIAFSLTCRATRSSSPSLPRSSVPSTRCQPRRLDLG